MTFPIDTFTQQEIDQRSQEIDEQIQIYKGATDDYSKEIYRSLLMEKRGRVMGWSPRQIELMGHVKLKDNETSDDEFGNY